MADAAERIAGIEYLVDDWIPRGMVTGVVAPPGTGKSAFALWLARSVVLGEPWFNGAAGPDKPGWVLWIDTENTTALTIHRMRDWDIPMENMLLPFEDPLGSFNLDSLEHLGRIKQLISLRRIRLVVVDSLRGGHGGDENSSGAMNCVMQNLARIAECSGAAIVVTHHTRKLPEGQEITSDSSRGSNAIFAMMRSQIGIDRPNPATPTRCRVSVLKENLGIRPEAVGFEITGSGLIFGEAPSKPKTKTETAQDRAIAFLREVMEPGVWTPAKQLLTQGKEEYDLSVSSIQRAREKLKIVKPNVRDRKNGSEWRLPPADS